MILDKYVGQNDVLPVQVRNGYEYVKNMVKKYGDLEARAREQQAQTAKPESVEK